MKFNEFKYQRPDIEKTISDIQRITKALEVEGDYDKVIELIEEYNRISADFSTNVTLCSIRNTINTVDEFYEAENEFIDENAPLVSNASNEYNKALLNCKIRPQLEEKYSKQYFTLLEIQSKCFDEKIIEDLVEEAKLSTEYSKLLASAQIEFDGKVNNLSQMGVYANNVDRDVRKASSVKVAEFMSSIEDKLDDIYDKLVKVRTRIANKMGYDNYIDYGYLCLNRSDYNSKDVANYRKQVLENVVPVAKKIIADQEKRIGVASLKSYDIPMFYSDGNPNHGKNKDELVNNALRFYSDLSEETKEFFKYMQDHELMDLETKPNKAGGGYCTMIANYKAPFIFSNFNGTMGDVDVLTHEAGHAFEVYTAAKELPIEDIYWPTLEACEIHSMSMEFFAYPYMSLFFDEDARKYRFKHLSEAITFIPYGVCVDEFQHFVYANPNATPKERKAKWRELEKKYTPWKDYDGIEYYENGGFWHKQSHIFQSPFYYIDYTLAQVCAFQFYLLDLDDHEFAWNKYFDLCKLGGSKSFVKLLEAVDLKNPFDDGCLSAIMPELEEALKDLEP